MACRHQSPASLERDSSMFIMRESEHLKLKDIATAFNVSIGYVSECVSRERIRRSLSEKRMVEIQAIAVKPVRPVQKVPVILPKLTITLHPDVNIDDVAVITAYLFTKPNVLHVGMPKDWLSRVQRMRMSPLSAAAKLEAV